MRSFLRLLILLGVLTGSAGLSFGAGFRTIETSDYRVVYYGDGSGHLAPWVARCTRNALAFQRRLFDYRPSEPVTILLHDLSDYQQAAAGTTPFNSVVLSMAPPNYAFETMPSNEAINTAVNHESVHLAMNDRSTRQDRFFRTLFGGKVREIPEQPLTILYGYLTQPRRSAPQWYHEGVAVFVDTWMDGGLGRAQGSYDEMVFRTAIRDQTPLYDLIGLESAATRDDFQVGMNAYLYGTRFVSYLALIYGPERVITWANRTDGSRGYFSAEFRKVYGKSLEQAWSEWLEWERDFQNENLEAIGRHPVTRTRPVSSSRFGMVSPACYDPATRSLYAAVNRPGQVAYLAELNIDTGDLTKLTEIRRPAMYSVTSIAFDSETGTLFYTDDNDQWRDLKRLDTHTGKQRTLLSRARMGDLALNPVDRSLWGIRHNGGVCQVVRIAPPYDDPQVLVTFPYGRNLHGIAISPDGRFLSGGLTDIDGSQQLVLMQTVSLEQGETAYRKLFDFGNSIPVGFGWSSDGRYLIGGSYYTGVANLFRYDVAADVMEAASNVETGLFYPVPIGVDSLIAFEYTADGFRPVALRLRPVAAVASITMLGQRVAEEHPVVREWLAGSPLDVPPDSIPTADRPYSGLGHVHLSSLYPVVQGYRAWPAYGMRGEMRDPLGLHTFDATVSYTPNENLPANERWHAEAGYARLHWCLRFRANGADFYDLFGPTKTSRKGYALNLTHDGFLMRDYPRELRYYLTTGSYWGLERLPEYQNITISYDRFVSFGGGLTYNDRRGSLGAVDVEKGWGWDIASYNSVVRGKTFARAYGTLDLGLPLPIDHTSIWLRPSAGYSPNPRREPLANFYFGGFGNNWVDHESVRRYRRFYSFPGIDLNAAGGTTFARLQAELLPPPLSFRRAGGTGLYATWLRSALFATVLMTNPDESSLRRTLYDIGGQVDLRLTLLSHLPMTLSFGAAAAFEDGRRPTHELMFSLKVL